MPYRCWSVAPGSTRTTLLGGCGRAGTNLRGLPRAKSHSSTKSLRRRRLYQAGFCTSVLAICTGRRSALLGFGTRGLSVVARFLPSSTRQKAFPPLLCCLLDPSLKGNPSSDFF
eukprot:3876251-Rhodomonas_salina.2